MSAASSASETRAVRETLCVRPQPGPQEMGLASGADIVGMGGAAGVGKSFWLLHKALAHIDNPKYGAVIFRRTRPELTNEGGLWDESQGLYQLLGAVPNQQRLQWKFKSGAKIALAQMQHEKDRFRWQGSQICFLGFDELTHFTWLQFNYLISRNRSTSGIRPQIAFTCNPDPNSWLRKWLDWWINRETGYPIPERSGKIRWFIAVKGETLWADSPRDLQKKYPKSLPKSVTFISGLATDNKILLQKNPEYLANLDALDAVQKARLKKGNWNADYTAGSLFRKEWFRMIDALPNDLRFVRGWDRAGTEAASGSDPDWTAGIKLGVDREKNLYIADLAHLRETPFKVRQAIKNLAGQDSQRCMVALLQDPGSAGKEEAETITKVLMGFPIEILGQTKDKVTRATPVSVQAEAGNIFVLRAPWNEAFFNELVSFPKGGHDDIVDALSCAFQCLVKNYDLLSPATSQPAYEPVGDGRRSKTFGRGY